jgi:hypothetical protein
MPAPLMTTLTIPHPCNFLKSPDYAYARLCRPTLEFSRWQAAKRVACRGWNELLGVIDDIPDNIFLIAHCLFGLIT